MKALAVAERDGLPRFVTQQIHYTLEAREAEYELAADRGRPGRRHPGLEPARRRAAVRQVRPRPGLRPRQLAGWTEPPIRDAERLWRIVDALKEIGAAHGVSAAQVALAWLLGRPGVSLAGDRRPQRGAVQGQPRRRRARSSPPRSAPASTRSARRRCSIPTGTSTGPPAAASARPTGCSTAVRSRTDPPGAARPWQARRRDHMLGTGQGDAPMQTRNKVLDDLAQLRRTRWAWRRARRPRPRPR